MVKIIFIDGPDDSGKTTLVKKILDIKEFRVKELSFNKALDGLLRINKEDQFEILRVLLPNLDPNYVYVMDRCYLSNIVYDGVSGEDIEPSLEFRDWCNNNLDSVEIILDRPHIETHLEDNLVSIDKVTYNEIINELKKQQGLESTEDLQEWTMKRVAGIVEKAGGRPAAWEVAGQGKNGGIGHDSVIFSWSGKEPGLKAVRDGYEVVMCPAQHVYFDMAHTDGHHEKGLNWAANISMIDALCWDPVPEDEPELELKIIGIQGELWSETVMEDKDMEPLLAPRILALSEVAWTDTKRKREFKEFIGVALYFGKIFKKFNWNSHELV